MAKVAALSTLNSDHESHADIATVQKEVSVIRGLLEGRPATATWDTGLSSAMAETGLALHEESFIDLLLGDLSAAVAIA